ncbi:MAG: peptidoglycan DD-metalloendopeptidase family protein [Myxococcales bacterium]|nr:peptidoglycan DD-metalloendopeptidase family protein [Myxococcales bacterium]
MSTIGFLAGVRSQFVGQGSLGADPDGIAAAAARGDEDEALREAARQFESVFVHQLFKSMRATVPKGGMTDAGFGGEVFTDMLDAEYARSVSSTGQLGLADVIAHELGARDAEGTAGHGLQSGGARRRGLRAYRAHAATAWQRPVRGRVSSGFGERVHPITGDTRPHHGLDIAAPAGTPIRAARAGKVTFAGERGGYGNLVEIDHGDGTRSRYAHASTLLVEAGQAVRRGELIAEVGSTGDSTGPHLHFEVRRGDEPIDPGPLLGAAGE